MHLGPSGHVDSFTRDNLPPFDLWPELTTGPEYPEWLNAGYELSDAMVMRGFGDHIALTGNGRTRTYKELADWSNRIARALIEDFGLLPGQRVLIRSANNPAMVAAWLGVTKAGGVAVNTMPMLRAFELVKIIGKARVSHVLCDTRLMEDMVQAAKQTDLALKVIGFDGTANHDGELDRAALAKPVRFDPVKTGRDDVALLAFTSGTTGAPKATMHFHRDLLMIADLYAREVLAVTPEDVFVGSPPLAFTFGLGGLAIFPLRFGAQAVLLEDANPARMIQIIQQHKATICFTAPTAYRVMLNAMAEGADLSSLRAAVSAGETLPAPIYEEWISRTGKPMLDGIGATEMLHIFITNRFGDSRPACTGRPVAGFQARIIGPDGAELPRGTVGRLAVRGPLGCRYMQDEGKQRAYVQDGWNLTGDAFMQDQDGYFHFAARQDGIILSAGYNIAGPEVEAALLAHPDVLECAVIGAPDPDRGQIVEAHVVLRPGVTGDAAQIKVLQDHVKAVIAPYKYPRSVIFRTALPKTESGKIQRFRLHDGL